MPNNSFKGKTLLIAGGAGFLGSHFVKKLLSLKDVKKVVVLDNFSSGSLNNIAEVINDPRLKVIETDISYPISKLTEEFDYVCHLAALANPIEYEKNPIATLTVNSDGVQNMIEIARKNNAYYVYFSSSEVYGVYDCLPYRGLSEEETVSRLILGKPRSPYAVGKCFGEELTRHFCGYYGNKYTIIRPFNVYGPNMDVNTNYGRVIPNFITWALKKEPLQINGDGTQIRTFCYIDDFMEALFRLLKAEDPPKVINIGSRQQIRILDLAQLINEMLANKPSGYRFVEKYQYEPMIRFPDLSMIFRLTGWKPETELGNGLRNTINWLKTHLKIQLQ